MICSGGLSVDFPVKNCCCGSPASFVGPVCVALFPQGLFSRTIFSAREMVERRNGRHMLFAPRCARLASWAARLGSPKEMVVCKICGCCWLQATRSLPHRHPSHDPRQANRVRWEIPDTPRHPEAEHRQQHGGWGELSEGTPDQRV